MECRDISKLAVCEIEKEAETVPVDELCHLYLNYMSNIIYVTKSKKLYGIICMKEALAEHGLQVSINKSFTALMGFNIVKAYRMFASKKINNIPVVNENGELIGDYSRWEDLLFLERNKNRLMDGEGSKKILGAYDALYVVEPIKRKYSSYLLVADCLKRSKIIYTVLDMEHIEGKLSENAWFIFIDDEERTGAECLLGMKIFHNTVSGNSDYKLKFTTYRSLLIQIMQENELNALGIEKPDYVRYEEVDDLANVLFSELVDKGVRCFGLFVESTESKDKPSEYCIAFQREVSERLKKYPLSIKEPWYKREQNPDFYAELYENEDYVTEAAQREIFERSAIFDKREVTGKYFNARNGRRVTCYQPKEYIGTIYIFGRCMILGTFVEDQYTIASILQKRLLEKGYAYRVENYGDVAPPYGLDAKLEEIGRFCENDIVIYLPPNLSKTFVGLYGITLDKIYEKHNIPSTWMTDSYAHGNHKVNQLVAGDILEMVESCLSKEICLRHKKFQFDIDNIMQGYVKYKYLDKHFSDWHAFGKVGTIVMVCDPFDRRHRYLIELAKKQVDFLIVFVLEQDIYGSCLFPFERRFWLVQEGIKDLENVMVVPSGFLDLSGINFPRNLIRTEHRMRRYAEYDIRLFANYVAKTLSVTHFFLEERPDYELVKMHNEIMKEILPQKGICCLGLETALKCEGISTSKIHTHLRNGEYEEAFEMLPEVTKQYCMELTGMI